MANGTIVLGDPSTPCMGIGTCEVNFGVVNQMASPEGMQCPVKLSGSAIARDKTSTLTIEVEVLDGRGVNNVAMLAAMDANCYYFLTNFWSTAAQGQAGTPGTYYQFTVSAGAAGFVLSADTTSQIWTDAPSGSSAAYSSQTWSFMIDSDGNWYIQIPVTIQMGTKSGNVGTFSATPSPMSAPISFGHWTVGQDIYGNLVFTNGTNQIVFGANGNASVDGCSVITDGSPIWIGLNEGGSAQNALALNYQVVVSGTTGYPTASWQGIDLANNFPNINSNLTLNIGNPFYNISGAD